MNRRGLLLAEVLAALVVATVAMGVMASAQGWRRIESVQDQRAALLELAQNRLADWRAGRPLPVDPAWTADEQRRPDGVVAITLRHRSGLRLTTIRPGRP